MSNQGPYGYGPPQGPPQYPPGPQGPYYQPPQQTVVVVKQGSGCLKFFVIAVGLIIAANLVTCAACGMFADTAHTRQQGAPVAPVSSGP